VTDSEQKIFIVDDAEDVRISLSLLLETSGYNVRTFRSALAFLDAWDPSWRGVVIADVLMPGMSGLELQKEMTMRGIDLPVIIITGHADVPMAVAALKEGAVDFIEKPFRDHTLMEAIEHAEQRQSGSSQNPESVDLYHARIESLSEREREIMHLLAAGHPNKIVADRLGISVRTVEVHRAHIMEKLHARNLGDLVRIAYRLDPPAT
jgi:two-component system response regulator FixJ